MSDEVIQALTLPKQINFLHLPVQSGSNRVLKKMNRRYTREHYLDIIDKVRDLRPAMAIGTDIIVGFCSETEKDFMDTVDLYLKADCDLSYTAMYSERSGTLAAKLYEDDVPREEKKRRWEYLQDIMEKNVLRKNQNYVGEILPVLVERSEPAISPDNKQLTWLYGKSLEQKLVQVAGEASLVGTIQPVKIVEAKEWILRGVRKQPPLKVSAGN